MIRFTVTIAALLMMLTNLENAARAESASPLNRPITDIKRDLASVAHCRWVAATPLIHKCDDLDGNSWIGLETTSDGKIDHIHFQPLIAEPIGVDRETQETIYSETKPARAKQAVTIAAIRKLWPTWRASDSWLRNAFKNARRKDFQNSIRIGDTSVYVSETGPVDSDDRFAFLVLTKKTDLTEFKGFPCSDDDQGPGSDSCADRNGEPRPPDNPILHPN